MWSLREANLFVGGVTEREEKNLKIRFVALMAHIKHLEAMTRQAVVFIWFVVAPRVLHCSTMYNTTAHGLHKGLCKPYYM